MHRRLLLSALLSAIFIVTLHSLGLSSGTPAGTVIPADSTITFVASGSTLSATGSASTTVARTAGVVVRAATSSQNVVPGQTYYIPVTVTNTGNATDTIALSASSAHSWAVSFIRDDNADSIHQLTEVTKITSTGSLTADASSKCFACVTMPTTATTGDTVTVTGTSVAVTSAYASAIISCLTQTAHTLAFTKAPSLTSSAVLSGGTTNCTATVTDSLGHQPIYAWSDNGAGGTFAPSAAVQSPAYTARANTTGLDVAVSLTCKASCSQGSSVAISASTPLLVHAAAAVAKVPGDFSQDGVVNSTDLALFNKQWLRWHQPTKPAFSAAVDGLYDLAPRASGIWPNWAPIGDKVINIQDATAFTECVMKSQNSSLAYNCAPQLYRTSSLMIVTLPKAPYAMYQVSVPLPSGVGFRPTLDANGNLARVYKGARAGSMFYTEYDSATRTIKITGNVTGYAPFTIASIMLGY